MKRALRITLRVVVVLFILLNILSAWQAYKLTHVPKKPNDIVAGGNTVYLTTKNNLKLEAWYFKTDSAKGTVLMFHGHGGNKAGIFAESVEFRRMHYNTLLLDFRAHGASEGSTCTIGFNESEDVKLAYDWAVSQGEKNIVLWGISMGAATISKAISDYSLKPNKVILEMPFGSILEAAEGRIRMMGIPGEPLAGLVTFWGGVENGFWGFNMKPTQFVKKIECPVLLQRGKQDPRVSQSEIDEIFENIHTAKKMVIYESAGHESLCKKEPEKWRMEVSAFLQ